MNLLTPGPAGCQLRLTDWGSCCCGPSLQCHGLRPTADARAESLTAVLPVASESGWRPLADHFWGWWKRWGDHGRLICCTGFLDLIKNLTNVKHWEMVKHVTLIIGIRGNKKGFLLRFSPEKIVHNAQVWSQVLYCFLPYELLWMYELFEETAWCHPHVAVAVSWTHVVLGIIWQMNMQSLRKVCGNQNHVIKNY